MRLVFCGTPEFAVPMLQRLLEEEEFAVEAVLTQPDRPKGRGLDAPASPVKIAALAAGIPIHQPRTVRAPEVSAWLAKLAPDAVVILAYGQIIPANLLTIPRLGWINLHASLLPKYRGAAPIAWAIANGESRSGLITMRIDAGMDTGPILLQQELEIGADETAPELSARMAEAGAPLVVETLRALQRDAITPRAQDHAQATYAPLLKRDHGRIDWTLPAAQIYNRIRAFAPWPGAFTTFRGHRCHVWGRPASADSPPSPVIAQQDATPGSLLERGDDLYVTCGSGTCLRIEAVQLEGRKRVTAREFLSGARLSPAEKFGQ